MNIYIYVCVCVCVCVCVAGFLLALMGSNEKFILLHKQSFRVEKSRWTKQTLFVTRMYKQQITL